MGNQSLLRFLGVFVGIFLAIIALVFILRNLKLSNSVYPFALSIGIGLIFSIASLGFILLSTKFGDWAFVDKLIYAGKLFPLVSFVFFIFMEIIGRKFKEENKKKIL